MILRKSYIAALLLFSATLPAGCAPEPTSPVDTAAFSAGTALSIEQQFASVGDLHLASPYAVSLDAIGALGANRTFLVAVTVKASDISSRIIVKVHVPEETVAASAGRSDGFRVPVGSPIPPVAERAFTLDAGSEFSFSIPIRILEPGSYRVSASVFRVGGDTLAAPIADAVHREMWLFLSAAGGDVGPEFEDTRVPPQFWPAPGPWRERPILQGATARSKASGPSQATASEAGYDYFQFVYWDYDSASYVPLPLVSVHHTTYREEYGNTVEIGSGYDGPGTNGLLAFYCGGLAPEEWYSGGAEMVNNMISLRGIAQFGWIGGSGGEGCGSFSTPSTPYTVIAPSNKGRVYSAMTFAAIASREFFSQTRGWIGVWAPETGNRAFYERGSDEITIDAGAAWGDYGRFVAGHEYGHALHHKSLGGIQGSDCPSPHFNDQSTSLSCAFYEGFATYHATASGFPYFDLEGENYTVGRVCQGYSCTEGSIIDGSVVEGAVASFLFSLTDAVGSPSDSVSFPGVYVTDIIRSCQLFTSPPAIIRRINGADLGSYCMERRVSPSVREAYFPTRSYTTIEFSSEQAVEPPGWTPDRVKALWKWALYRQ